MTDTARPQTPLPTTVLPGPEHPLWQLDASDAAIEATAGGHGQDCDHDGPCLCSCRCGYRPRPGAGPFTPAELWLCHLGVEVGRALVAAEAVPPAALGVVASGLWDFPGTLGEMVAMVRWNV